MLRALLLFAGIVLLPPRADDPAAPVWQGMGPPGGDVYSLAADPADPQRVYLGTADGHVFGSRDAGESWALLGRAGSADGVLMTLLVDASRPAVLLAASWSRNGAGGGVYRSEDYGATWQLAGLGGQAVRALVQSPSHPEVLIAGALDGVFRSSDSGRTWLRISPADDPELQNIDSLAVDPRNPEVIYAGTFHLPWKTTDGGRRWVSIHNGMIDDSDVMSIVVDRTNPRRLYASACSGIYRSDSAGQLWRKIQGIPFSARRTHVIRQDPRHAGTVYAGTTEGLWKTTDSGASWRRITPSSWTINALIIHPTSPERLLLGTERLGVQVSTDAGKTFRAANRGFYHRQVLALALDRTRPGRVLAVLSNSPEPILATENGGASWLPLGPGLRSESLRRVYALNDTWIAALERGGMMRYNSDKAAWSRAGTLLGEAAATLDKKGKRIPAKGPRPFDLPIHDMAASRDAWFAATPGGLLVSRDAGVSWELFHVGPVVLPVRSVRVSADEQFFWVVTLRGMAFSRDAGQSWTWHDLPYDAGGALRLDVLDSTTLFATARHGLYISRDAGKSWQQAASGLPEAPIQDLAISGDTVLASMQTRGLYISYDRGRTWTRIEGTLAEGFFPVVSAPDRPDTIFAASSTDGVYSIQLGASRAQRVSSPWP